MRKAGEELPSSRQPLPIVCLVPVGPTTQGTGQKCNEKGKV